MSVIFLLIIFSLLLAIVFLMAFIWSVKDGQYEDDYTPSVRILFEDSNITPTIDNNQLTTESSTTTKKV
jgi:cbb3-type cytochrome oxidase maturation protein